MRYGILSGALWGLDTVILGMALLLAPFLGAGSPQSPQPFFTTSPAR